MSKENWLKSNAAFRLSSKHSQETESTFGIQEIVAFWYSS
jgi:hypothetical protein